LKEQVSNAEVLAAFPKLGEVSQLKLPVKSSFGVARLVNSLNSAYQPIIKVRDDLIRKYGTETKAGFTIKPGDKNWSEYAAEFSELLVLEVEIEFEKVTLPDAIEVEPATLLPLMRFLNI